MFTQKINKIQKYNKIIYTMILKKKKTIVDVFAHLMDHLTIIVEIFLT